MHLVCVRWCDSDYDQSIFEIFSPSTKYVCLIAETTFWFLMDFAVWDLLQRIRRMFFQGTLLACQWLESSLCPKSPKIASWTFHSDDCALSRLSVPRMQRRVDYVLKPHLAQHKSPRAEALCYSPPQMCSRRNVWDLKVWIIDGEIVTNYLNLPKARTRSLVTRPTIDARYELNYICAFLFSICPNYTPWQTNHAIYPRTQQLLQYQGAPREGVAAGTRINCRGHFYSIDVENFSHKDFAHTLLFFNWCW